MGVDQYSSRVSFGVFILMWILYLFLGREGKGRER